MWKISQLKIWKFADFRLFDSINREVVYFTWDTITSSKIKSYGHLTARFYWLLFFLFFCQIAVEIYCRQQQHTKYNSTCFIHIFPILFFDLQTMIIFEARAVEKSVLQDTQLTLSLIRSGIKETSTDDDLWPNFIKSH